MARRSFPDPPPPRPPIPPPQNPPRGGSAIPARRDTTDVPGSRIGDAIVRIRDTQLAADALVQASPKRRHCRQCVHYHRSDSFQTNDFRQHRCRLHFDLPIFVSGQKALNTGFDCPDWHRVPGPGIIRIPPEDEVHRSKMAISHSPRAPFPWAPLAVATVGGAVWMWGLVAFAEFLAARGIL